LGEDMREKRDENQLIRGEVVQSTNGQK